ncbi:acyl-CoA dehydratase activase-related protein [Desulfovirgula thermocuniculi]|uniref:acyl-CoA dehydratase activase-related protein n=1 Tax=Desulfovirgula thermocuniculi TaxID=348842 RepID=UPI00040BDF20|nr:acyl-CoA dehydratase activase-related protein [Desulfovirgula thermocuniculi]
MPRIGIPRALLYYHYFPWWEAFFVSLGAEVVISPPTTKAILDRGLEHAADDVCLPVKVAVGHVLELKDRVDAIFLPRLVSVAAREYICPKFLGLPEMVGHSIKGLPPLLSPGLNLYRGGSPYHFFAALGRALGYPPWQVLAAYRRACRVQQQYKRLLESGLFPEEALAALRGRHDAAAPRDTMGSPLVAVIGHPYNIYDAFVSMDLLGKLGRRGIKVITADSLSEENVCRGAAHLPKRLFWTLGRRTVGAAYHYLQWGRVDGMIHVSSFACGPDSFAGEFIARRAHRMGLPFLSLVLDEHSGEAGMVTRLEAFLDMVERRKKYREEGSAS